MGAVELDFLGPDIQTKQRIYPHYSTPENENNQSREWWREAVIYQIYPASFKDTDGDGIGDLQGVIDKLDYLKDLGVSAIWLTPFFKSPRNDGGYDVSNYMQVDPQFGDESTFKDLIKETHEKDMKLIIDVVTNHTSDQHTWFKRSRSSKDNPQRDVYVWKDPKPDGSPPNNWQSFFGGSAWTYDDTTGQYYFHKFDSTQPDLNLYNPKVREHMERIIERYCEMGIDGVRLDVIDHTFHKEDFNDVEPNLNGRDGSQDVGGFRWQEVYLSPNAHIFAREISQVLKKHDAVGIGELHYDLNEEPYSDFSHLRKFYTEGGIQIPFNFSLLHVASAYGADASALKRFTDKYMEKLPEEACSNFVLGNHDENSRLIDKVGRENMPAITMMLLTLGSSGGSMPFIYQGDEIGMSNGHLKPSDIKDPIGKRLGIELSRDHSRTPMQWESKKMGGFTDGEESWLPIGDTSNGATIADQSQDPNSLLSLTNDLIALRKTNQALKQGLYVPIHTETDGIFAFGRNIDQQNVIVILNLSPESHNIKIPYDTNGKILISTDRARDGQPVTDTIQVGNNEGCVLEVERAVMNE